jgi:hypothetical protein
VKKTIVSYELTNLVSIEVTRYPKTRSIDIEFIVGGEGYKWTKDDLKKFLSNVNELRKDFKP